MNINVAVGELELLRGPVVACSDQPSRTLTPLLGHIYVFISPQTGPSCVCRYRTAPFYQESVTLSRSSLTSEHQAITNRLWGYSSAEALTEPATH